MSQRAVTLNPGGASASLFTRREKRAQRPSRAGKPRMMMNNLCHLRRHCTFVIHETNFGCVRTFCQATRRHLLIAARPRPPRGPRECDPLSAASDDGRCSISMPPSSPFHRSFCVLFVYVAKNCGYSPVLQKREPLKLTINGYSVT